MLHRELKGMPADRAFEGATNPQPAFRASLATT
jgi:hypothetical protein